MAPELKPLWPTSLSTKEPANRATIKARSAEYQAVIQFLNRFCRRTCYIRSTVTERRQILKEKIAAFLTKRKNQGRIMCAINVDEMIARHLRRQAQIKRLKKAGVVPGRYPSDRIQSPAPGREVTPDDDVSDNDEDEEESDEGDAHPQTRARPSRAQQEQAVRIQRLENTIDQLKTRFAAATAQGFDQPPIQHPVNLQAGFFALEDQNRRLLADNQVLCDEVRAHQKRIVALENHAAETDDRFDALGGISDAVRWLVRQVRGDNSTTKSSDIA